MSSLLSVTWKITCSKGSRQEGYNPQSQNIMSLTFYALVWWFIVYVKVSILVVILDRIRRKECVVFQEWDIFFLLTPHCLHLPVRGRSLLPYLHYFVSFVSREVCCKMFSQDGELWCFPFIWISSGCCCTQRNLDELAIVWGTCGVDVGERSNQRQTLSTSPPGSWAWET